MHRQCFLEVRGSSREYINGCYIRLGAQLNGYAQYVNAEADNLKVMYHAPGQWIIADGVEGLKRAYLSVKESEDGGPFGSALWRVQQENDVRTYAFDYRVRLLLI